MTRKTPSDIVKQRACRHSLCPFDEPVGDRPLRPRQHFIHDLFVSHPTLQDRQSKSDAALFRQPRPG